MNGAEPFDRALRRRARDRGWPLRAADAFLHAHVVAELGERMTFGGAVPPGRDLWVGLGIAPPAGAIALDPGFRAARAHHGAQADEDRLPIADQCVARIVAPMTLHGVNDLPGALILFRRALLPGGRLFAGFPGGFSLMEVRAAFLSADAAAGGVAARLGPTVDPAEAAGLLQRAGFADPVVDVETLTVRYRRLADLAHDVRRAGDSGWLAARDRRPMARARWAAAEAAFAAQAEADGKVPVAVQILYLAARAP